MHRYKIFVILLIVWSLVLLLLYQVPRPSIIKLKKYSDNYSEDLNDVVSYLSMQTVVQQQPYEFMDSYSSQIEYKTVHFWRQKNSYFKGLGRSEGKYFFRHLNCPVWHCQLTYNESTIERDDAVLFNEFCWNTEPSDLYDTYCLNNTRIVPEKRSKHQRYVLWSLESPGRGFFTTRPMAGFFNWTFTYRWDSDFVFPYGWFIPTNNQTISERNYAENKTKIAAWFVSNCQDRSGRKEYVNLLKQFVQVDVYGLCGDLSCSRDGGDCQAMLSKDYKFYLALENTLCKDYVTEKLFGQMKHPDVVPIVFDLHGHTRRLAPKGSFINAADFGSVRELAEYLKLLDKNDTLYNSYFEWKRHFVVEDDYLVRSKSLCKLCALLHQSDQSSPVNNKVYDDMNDWWDVQSNCQTLEFAANDDEGRWRAVPLPFQPYYQKSK